MTYTIEDFTGEEDIKDWLPKDILSMIEVKFSTTPIVCEGLLVETKFYPYDDCCENNLQAIEFCLKRAKRTFKTTLLAKAEEFLAEHEKGVLYFSPARKMAYVNTPAKILYTFGHITEDNKMYFQLESNFIFTEGDVH